MVNASRPVEASAFAPLRQQRASSPGIASEETDERGKPRAGSADLKLSLVGDSIKAALRGPLLFRSTNMAVSENIFDGLSEYVGRSIAEQLRPELLKRTELKLVSQLAGVCNDDASTRHYAQSRLLFYAEQFARAHARDPQFMAALAKLHFFLYGGTQERREPSNVIIEELPNAYDCAELSGKPAETSRVDAQPSAVADSPYPDLRQNPFKHGIGSPIAPIFIDPQPRQVASGIRRLVASNSPVPVAAVPDPPKSIGDDSPRPARQGRSFEQHVVPRPLVRKSSLEQVSTSGAAEIQARVPAPVRAVPRRIVEQRAQIGLQRLRTHSQNNKTGNEAKIALSPLVLSIAGATALAAVGTEIYASVAVPSAEEMAVLNHAHEEKMLRTVNDVWDGRPSGGLLQAE